MTEAPDPAFDTPWHAQLFALTVSLNESGHFAWTEWAAAFGATLKRRGVSRELNGGDDYFNAWLETLEALLTERGMAEVSALSGARVAWERAYLRTPHGAPVHLDD